MECRRRVMGFSAWALCVAFLAFPACNSKSAVSFSDLDGSVHTDGTIRDGSTVPDDDGGDGSEPTDDAAPDAPPVPVGPAVLCHLYTGDQYCDESNPVCCVPNPSDSHSVPVPLCVENAATCRSDPFFGIPFECDDTSDCGSGQVCCVSTSGTRRARCVSSCTGSNNHQACEPNADTCPGSKFCTGSTYGYSTCE